MNWEEKLNKFLDEFEHIDDVIGVLVCGSYITGNPSTHSDLDVHIILDEKVDYRKGLYFQVQGNVPKGVYLQVPTLGI